MNTDYRIHISFRNSTKRKKLHRLLGPDAVICLIDLWGYAAENRPLGVLEGMTRDDIEIAVDWSGKPGNFVDTLVDLKLLDFDGEMYQIHNWEERNPWAFGAENRKKKARKAANARWGTQEKKTSEKQPVNASSNATSMQQEMISNAPLLSSPFLSSPKPSSSNKVVNKTEEKVKEKNEERMISKDIEDIHFKVFGHPITQIEVDQLKNFPEKDVLDKYEEAQERVGTGKDVRFFKWIVNGLKGDRDGTASTNRGFFDRIKQKTGKIGAAYGK